MLSFLVHAGKHINNLKTVVLAVTKSDLGLLVIAIQCYLAYLSIANIAIILQSLTTIILTQPQVVQSCKFNSRVGIPSLTDHAQIVQNLHSSDFYYIIMLVCVLAFAIYLPIQHGNTKAHPIMIVSVEIRSVVVFTVMIIIFLVFNIYNCMCFTQTVMHLSITPPLPHPRAIQGN